MHRRKRRVHDERHAHRALVDEEAVLRFAVLVETLTVIADHHDDGAVEQTARLERLHDAPDLRVGERNLTLIRLIRIAPAVRLRRLVRRVRVIEVNPREERRRVVLLNPRQRAVDDLVSGTLDRAH